MTVNDQQQETKMRKWTSVLAGIALVVGCSFVYGQNTSPAPMPTSTSKPAAVGANNGTATSEPAVKAGSWINVSEDFSRQIGAHDLTPGYLNGCQGFIVTPTGDLVMQTSKKGICISHDQGVTWSVVADNDITGRCEHGCAFSIAYPYDGRMAIFSFDGGPWGTSGGMTLDGGKTWKAFTKVQRGVEFGDVYWDTRDPQTVYAVTHEPFFSLLSDDGGRSWRRLDREETGGKTNYCVGLINAKTLTRYNPNKDGGIIELSEDAGRTWSKVADYHVTGRSAVHYGRKVYWTTSKGVITSTDGKDWTLTGAGAEGASYGPYFGASDQEFVVVTKQEFVVVTKSAFLKTEDGGKTWKPIAKLYKAPDIFHDFAGYSFFGWDAKHNILYASGLGASVYKLQVEGATIPDEGRGVEKK
jgi:photosystem II stability/assembly factor-like uncharacterized protein